MKILAANPLPMKIFAANCEPHVNAIVLMMANFSCCHCFSSVDRLSTIVPCSGVYVTEKLWRSLITRLVMLFVFT